MDDVGAAGVERGAPTIMMYPPSLIGSFSTSHWDVNAHEEKHRNDIILAPTPMYSNFVHSHVLSAR